MGIIWTWGVLVSCDLLAIPVRLFEIVNNISCFINFMMFRDVKMSRVFQQVYRHSQSVAS